MTVAMTMQNWNNSSHVTITVTPSRSRLGVKRSIHPRKRSIRGVAYRGTGGTTDTVTHILSKRKEKIMFCGNIIHRAAPQ